MRSEPTPATLLIACAVGALWVGCIVLIVAAILLGMTVAIHRLFRRQENGWVIAVGLAPVVATGALLIVAVLVRLEFIGFEQFP